MSNAPESLRLFHLAEATQWNHLPVAGGLYDQHPRLIEEWELIFGAKSEYERQERARQEQKTMQQSRRKGR